MVSHNALSTLSSAKYNKPSFTIIRVLMPFQKFGTQVRFSDRQGSIHKAGFQTGKDWYTVGRKAEVSKNAGQKARSKTKEVVIKTVTMK